MVAHKDLPACSSNEFSRKLKLKIVYFENARIIAKIVYHFCVGSCNFSSISMPIFFLRWSPEITGVSSEQSTGGPCMLPHCVNTSGGKFQACLLYTPSHLRETSRKWLTVAIFRKWQDISVALLIDIAVILNWR